METYYRGWARTDWDEKKHWPEEEFEGGANAYIERRTRAYMDEALEDLLEISPEEIEALYLRSGGPIPQSYDTTLDMDFCTSAGLSDKDQAKIFALNALLFFRSGDYTKASESASMAASVEKRNGGSADNWGWMAKTMETLEGWQ